MAKKRKIEITQEDENDFSENLEEKDLDKSEMESGGDNMEENMEEEKFVSDEDQLRIDLNEARKKANENWETFLRARADYENLKKRTQNQVSQSIITGKRSVVFNLLEVLDNFERALNVDENTVSAKNILIGVRMIHKQLAGILSDEGLKEVPTVGNIFDPRLHEAIESIASDEYQDEEIVGEFLKGYIFKEELLRPAKVKVARNSEASSEEASEEI